MTSTKQQLKNFLKFQREIQEPNLDSFVFKTYGKYFSELEDADQYEDTIWFSSEATREKLLTDLKNGTPKIMKHYETTWETVVNGEFEMPEWCY